MTPQGQRWFLWKLHPVRLRRCLYLQCWWFALLQVCVSGVQTVQTHGQGSWVLPELTRKHVNSAVSLMLSRFLITVYLSRVTSFSVLSHLQFDIFILAQGGKRYIDALKMCWFVRTLTFYKSTKRVNTKAFLKVAHW